MRSLFSNQILFCGDISLWDVHSVTDMSYMFNGCKMFRGTDYVLKSSYDRGMKSGIGTASVPDEIRCCAPISGWDVRNVRDMTAMFRGSGFVGNVRDW